MRHLERALARGAAIGLLLLASCGGAAGAAPPPQQPPDPPPVDAHLIDGLRQRGRFSLAEKLCRRRLAAAGLSPREQADWTIELARTLVAGGMAEPSPLGSDRWREAHRVCRDFVAAHPDHPFGQLVALQGCLAWIEQARVTDILSVPRDRTTTRKYLRRALRRLDALSAQLNVAPPERRGKRTEADRAMTGAEFESLRHRVRYFQARALRLLGATYDPGDVDRGDALGQAIEKLAPLAELPVADELIWQCRLEEIACLRLLGRLDDAERRLGRIEVDRMPARLRCASVAQRVRLLLAGRQVQAARAAADGPAGESSGGCASLALARLEAALAAWRQAAAEGRGAQVAALAEEIAQRIDRLEARFGPLALRQAETALIAAATGAEKVEGRAMLPRLAASFARAGRVKEAIDLYDRIARDAWRRQAADAAFRAAFAAATLARREHRDAEAARRYRELSLRTPDHPRAADAHLLAVFHTARCLTAASPPARAAAAARYAQLLEEQLARWPRAAASHQARLYLGKLRESQGQWEAAVRAYRSVEPSAAEFPQAVRGVVRCTARQLAGEREEAGERKKAAEGLAREIARYLRQVVSSADGAGSGVPPPLARYCRLTEAALLVHYDRQQWDRAERILGQLLASGPPAPPAMLDAARRVMIVVTAARGNYRQADALLDQWELADRRQPGRPGAAAGGGPVPPVPRELVGGPILFERLLAFARAAPPAHQRRLAAVALRVVERIEASGDRPSGSASQALLFGRVEGLLLAGRGDRAVDAAEALIAANPGDGRLQESLARLLVGADEMPVQRAGLELARRVERRSRPGGPRWLRSRYLQARGLHRLGDDQAAVRVIEATSAVYPELGGRVLRGEFERLRAACRSGAR